ncbi:MAG: hypothetical protein ACRDTS_06055, partial [Mycobacterium sp.]
RHPYQPRKETTMNTDDEIEPAPSRPCPHCGGGPDTVLVRERITTYEYHLANCPTITDEVR